MKGCAADQLPSYIDEFMWSERYGKTGAEARTNIIHCISTQYPVLVYTCTCILCTYMQPRQPETPLCYSLLLLYQNTKSVLQNSLYACSLHVRLPATFHIAGRSPTLRIILYVHTYTLYLRTERATFLDTMGVVLRPRPIVKSEGPFFRPDPPELLCNQVW